MLLESPADPTHPLNRPQQAYGPDGLGILTVSGVPGYEALRQRLLPLAEAFAVRCFVCFGVCVCGCVASPMHAHAVLTTGGGSGGGAAATHAIKYHTRRALTLNAQHHKNTYSNCLAK